MIFPSPKSLLLIPSQKHCLVSLLYTSTTFTELHLKKTIGISQELFSKHLYSFLFSLLVIIILESSGEFLVKKIILYRNRIRIIFRFSNTISKESQKDYKLDSHFSQDSFIEYNNLESSNYSHLAKGAGFEPAMALTPYQFSRLAHSTALTPFHIFFNFAN